VNEGVEDSEGQRWVSLDGAFNFRDVGGYAASDRAQVAWGSVFRSDALHHLSADGLAAVAELGVDRVIDLRSPEEVAAVGRVDVGDGPIEYVNAPVLPSLSGEATGVPASDDIAARYLWYLDVGREALVEVFEILAEPGRGAAVFHCAAGKDRTGVVAALLLGVLGVSDDDIVSDYALTTRALPAILDRLAADPVHGAAVAAMPASRRTVRPETMDRFLRLLGDEHGGARMWAENAGVASVSVEALRTRMRVPI
jgi:protein-tyrosine phosphatase